MTDTEAVGPRADEQAERSALLSAVPPPTARGDYCTSADAAGLPVLPLIFTPDEVASGNIEHALRFVLPNEHIREDRFVRPGTHSTPSTSGPATPPPYASRLRLKANTDISGLSEGAQVIARALKKYGMILADGGRWTFAASTDELTTHTLHCLWNGLRATGQRSYLRLSHTDHPQTA